MEDIERTVSPSSALCGVDESTTFIQGATAEVSLAEIREQREALPVAEIIGIGISVLNRDTIDKIAVVTIKSTETSGQNTVFDPRLGPTEQESRCASCGADVYECKGHNGRIVLNTPILHPLMVRYILAVLRCVCMSCGGLIFTEAEIRDQGYMAYTGWDRLEMLEKNYKTGKCLSRIRPEEGESPSVRPRRSSLLTSVEEEGEEPHMCPSNPEFLTKESVDGQTIYYRLGKKEKKMELPVSDVAKILGGISNEDAALLGFSITPDGVGSHPRDFVMERVLVIPPCARPVSRSGGIDAMSRIYIEIVRWNNKYAADLAKEEARINARSRLVDFILTLIVKQQHPHQKKDKNVSIFQSFNGKKGAIRDTLMGKRVDFAARTVVVSGGSYVPFGKVAVPYSWAPIETPRELVTSENIAYLTGLLRSGKIVRIVPGSGRYRGSLIGVTDAIRKRGSLKYGDYVDRWLQEGDFVVLNRQPTLHKEGMMGHEVMFSPGDPDKGYEQVIHLHNSATTPYNADYDGDEMNIHIPRTPESRAEVEALMNVKNCVMSGQNSAPMMGLIQDAVTSAYLLTCPIITNEDPLIYEDVEVSPTIWDACIMAMGDAPQLADLEFRLFQSGIRKYTGKALFSATLPAGFRYRKTTSSVTAMPTGLPEERIEEIRKVDRNAVDIVDGILISGIITSEHVGAGAANSIMQRLFKWKGPNAVADFLTYAPFLLDAYISARGFSVGPEDCRPPGKKARETIEAEIAKMRIQIEAMGPPPKDPILAQEREREIVGKLDMVKDIGAHLLRSVIPAENTIGVMYRAGSKGNPLNTSQIMGLMAQQFSQGVERIPQCISGGERSSIYFEPGDQSPQARGFCTSSLYAGLRPSEFMFHSIAGRSGITASALSISDIGYLHKRLNSAMEDLKVVRDGTVRDVAGNIVQFVYGGDGYDPMHLQQVEFGETRVYAPVDVEQIARELNSKHGVL